MCGEWISVYDIEDDVGHLMCQLNVSQTSIRLALGLIPITWLIFIACQADPDSNFSQAAPNIPQLIVKNTVR